jgi:hypothetical protein
MGSHERSLSGIGATNRDRCPEWLLCNEERLRRRATAVPLSADKRPLHPAPLGYRVCVRRYVWEGRGQAPGNGPKRPPKHPNKRSGPLLIEEQLRLAALANQEPRGKCRRHSRRGSQHRRCPGGENGAGRNYVHVGMAHRLSPGTQQGQGRSRQSKRGRRASSAYV